MTRPQHRSSRRERYAPRRRRADDVARRAERRRPELPPDVPPGLDPADLAWLDGSGLGPDVPGWTCGDDPCWCASPSCGWAAP